MGLVRFEKGARFVWDGFLYVIEERLIDNTFRLKNLNIGGYKVATRMELATAWASGKLVFETFGHNAVKSRDQLIATSYTVADFKSLPESLQYVAWRRYQYVLPFVGLPAHMRTRKVITVYITANKDILEARARAYKEGFKHPMPALPPVPYVDKPKRVRRGSDGPTSTDESATVSGAGEGRAEIDMLPAQQWRRTEQPRMEQTAKRKPLDEAASAPSVERWLADFALSGFSLRGLVTKTKVGRAKHKSKLDAAVEDIITKVLDEYRGKEGQTKTKRGLSSGYNSIEDIRLTIAQRVTETNRERFTRGQSELNKPSYDIVRDRIYQSGHAEEILKRPPSGRLEAHEGAMIQAGVLVRRIMERIELDDTWLDLMVVDEVRRLPLGRPNITAASDVHTGMVGGYYLGFEGSSSNAARQCLLHLILPKPDTRELYNTDHTWDVWGTPEKVVTDGGPGFNSGHMFISCGEAGFIFEILPVQTAWWKPHIERFFRSLTEKLLKPLPGSTFSNIIERGGYDPAQYACISLTALIEALHTFFVDMLPSQWHSGRECYPRKRWEEQALQYEPVLYHSADELRRIFSRTEARMIHDYGIEFETIGYNSLALQALADRVETGNPDKLEPGKKVRIKVRDYDLSSIDVIDETNPDAHVALTVPSVNPRYTKDLSLWSHRIIRKFVNMDKAEGAQESLEDLLRAKEHLQEIVSREFLLTNSAKRRQNALRFLDETGAGQQPGGPKVTSSSVPKPKATAPATLSAPLALPSPSTSLPSPEAPAVQLVQVSSLPELDPLPERPVGDYSLPGRNTGPRRGGIGGGTANNKG